MIPEKIGPALQVALADYEADGRPGLIRHVRSLGVVPSVATPKPARTVVFIDCDPNANLDGLAEYGIIVNQRRGRVRTAFLPLDQVGRLSDEPAVRQIHMSRYLRPTMNVAPGRVHLPDFRQRTNLNGSGVVIGVVDTGIDPNHPAFAGRILRIWDQTLSGPGVAEGGYGLEFAGSQITGSRDFEGHGTHVAGIAAGNDATFGGVAPGADLVIVKTSFQNAHIADGIRYIFRVARDMGRPAVINLSLGGHFDPHDGTDPLSLLINAESGRGRIVCCAAGNEGNDNIHGQGIVPANGNRTMRFRIPIRTVGTALLNGWYPGNCTFEISVRSPGGFVTPYQPIFASGSPIRRYNLPDATVFIVTPGPDPTNGDHNFLVEIGPSALGTAVEGGIWQLRVRNTSANRGRLDVWTLDDQPATATLFTGTSVQDRVKIGSPGSATSAITVAAYTTKIEWNDVDGIRRAVGLTLDDIADFSSEGPRRDNARKPDVAAPGAMIGAALSADSNAPRAMMIDARHVIMAGTSMATPFISGVVALLLQRDPTLRPNDVKALLKAQSTIPGRKAGSFDAKWGFGLLDMLNL